MTAIFDYEAYEAKLPQLASEYHNAKVFPHIAIEHFLNEFAVKAALAEFPPVSDEGWIHYIHVSEKKGGLNKREHIPANLLAIIDELNSPKFVSWLSKLTGIEGLFADPTLEGGGIHQIEKGGFLNIHADFTIHPHHRMWKRRVNVLLYLNENWEESFGGHLELWEKDMSGCFEKILPIFNRCVIFNTDRDSFHGHPNPLTCPDGVTRKSIALYYFTEEQEKPEKIATNYQARPSDGTKKSLLIYLDKKALSFYNWLKGKLGINDDFVSKILKFIANIKK